jgi:Amt family ammonium transporter
LRIALLFVLFGDIALAEDAGPPACGGKILENCTPNSGDTAWMLIGRAV